MRFDQIKYDGKEMYLRWIVKIGEVEGKYHITSKNEPSGSFRDALKQVGAIALDILEFPRTIQNLRATGAAFSEDKKGDRGATITCIKLCAAANVGVAINTPYLKERSETQSHSPGLYIDGMQDALDELEAEANLYFKGLERQGNLFDQSLGVIDGGPDDGAEEAEVDEAMAQ